MIRQCANHKTCNALQICNSQELRVPLFSAAAILDNMSDFGPGRQHECRRAGHRQGEAAAAERDGVEQRIGRAELRDDPSVHWRRSAKEDRATPSWSRSIGRRPGPAESATR